MRRSELKRGKSVLKRSELKRGRDVLRRGAPKARVLRTSVEEKELRRRWAEAVPYGMDGHHALRRSVIERLAGRAGLPVLVMAWDTAWLIPLSRDVHAAHTSRAARLPVSVVPRSAWEVARFLDAALVRVGVPPTAVLELRREYA